ncbi:hypothetical protein ACFOWX_08215 [Sphingorhabdus arenilitoris]|uniref:Uncharacterized protein n=1 Tax=Sphingorhabdus arenilitoris TaxID=1490041 RepID=A0ABV8RG66_9SPHN
MKLRKYAALGLAIIAPLGLSGCLILPGEFTSEMTVMKSGEFSFSYKGQIQLLGLANMLGESLSDEGAVGEFEASCWGPAPDPKTEEAKKEEEKKAQKKLTAYEKSHRNEAALAKIKLGKTGTAASATAQEDYELVQEDAPAKPDEDDSDTNESDETAAEAAAAAVEAVREEVEDSDFSERECTAAEVEEQRAEWDEAQAARKKREEEQKKIFAMLLGGIDPKDPKTIERFTKEVERLAGWNKVEHLGDGLFMVDYTTKGQLADDFAFPVIPRYAIGQPMIHITRWDDGRLRVEAPAFHSDPDFSLLAMMGGSAMTGMMRGQEPKVQPVAVKGTFTLTTDAEILANNTEEGPADQGGMKKLSWEVSPDIFGPPMALLKLK